ncbi:methyltransferase [Halobacteriovorax sp. HLS]|uniref:methyltransferase n=1 Tax=Halobacteriovorax sp. HLS TaxID=2234000 RepID=UPI000FD76492|nr:methyltransferase [Halobacteriovorax sp. HLS]
MSILNYSQPDFYKFNTDSLELAKFSSQWMKGRKDLKVLDLCSGCGVIGIEFFKKHQSVKEMHFIEKQLDFHSHLKKNIENISCVSQIFIQDYKDHDRLEKYDLILINPPYFINGKGRTSPDERRQVCRSFGEGELESLIEFSKSVLNFKGEIHIVHRDDISLKLDSFKLVEKLNAANLFRFILNED